MLDDRERSESLYHSAQDAVATSDFERALSLLEQSLAVHVHYKTLEQLGEVLCRLGRHRDAIVPLAAATGLSRVNRPPCLLAEAFAELGDWVQVQKAAEESLRRTPHYARAQELLAAARRHLNADETS